MNLRSHSFIPWTLALSLLAACATEPQEEVLANPNLARKPPPEAGAQSARATEPAAPARYRRPAPSGHRFNGSGVTGDYAGYAALDRFIDRMAREHAFSRDYLNGLFSQVERKRWTLNYLGRESGPSEPRPGAWSRYRAKFLTEAHISQGAAFWSRHARVLNRASARYGVPPEYITSILGVETNYGGNLGNHRVIDALTTLAFDYPRRADYFQKELEDFLLMTRTEGMDPTTPVGSFAGAMGLGQFMPGSFLQWAVDFDGDGQRDLWQSADAIGSVANYFAQHGWQPDAAVVTPAQVAGRRAAALESGFDTRYTLATLADYGVRPAGQLSGDDSSSLHLLRLSTNQGEEYWLGHQNFYVITRYNHSTHYAMAVHQLAQAIKERYQGSVTARSD